MRERDQSNGAVEQAEKLECMTAFREEDEPPDLEGKRFKKAVVVDKSAADLKMTVAAAY